jgi:hypothetical protein
MSSTVNIIKYEYLFYRRTGDQNFLVICTTTYSVPVNINKEDMSVAMTLVQPSGMREVQLEIPQVIDNIYILLQLVLTLALFHPGHQCPPSAPNIY